MFRFVSPIISIALAIGIFFFFTKPMFDEISVIQNETNEYREAVEKATEYNNQLQRLITQRNSFSSLEIERLEALVPSALDEIRILIDLQAIAEQNGMLFGNVDLSPEEEGTVGADGETTTRVTEADFTTMEVSFGVIGTYDQLKSLLRDVERSLTLMEIVNFGFSVAEGDLNQYTFTVRAFSLTPFVQQ